MRDPGKGGDNVHDVDSAGPGLWASRSSGPDLQNGTDNIGGRIGYLGADAGTTTRVQKLSMRGTFQQYGGYNREIKMSVKSSETNPKQQQPTRTNNIQQQEK